MAVTTVMYTRPDRNDGVREEKAFSTFQLFNFSTFPYRYNYFNFQLSISTFNVEDIKSYASPPGSYTMLQWIILRTYKITIITHIQNIHTHTNTRNTHYGTISLVGHEPFTKVAHYP